MDRRRERGVDKDIPRGWVADVVRMQQAETKRIRFQHAAWKRVTLRCALLRAESPI
jgi:hypothetical protein